MIINEFGNETVTAVSVMRREGSFGSDAEQLQDGNTIPRLCLAIGEKACANGCKLSSEERKSAGVMCAENNITSVLTEINVRPDNFVLAAARREKAEDGTEFDNVFFADALEDTKAYVSPEGYVQVPAANAFFFRPEVDSLPNGEKVTALGMRMADCGSVNYEMRDAEGNLVLGQAHFSRINMRGPSKFEHEVDGKRVSFGEFVLANALAHYGADPHSVKIKLTAAIEGKDFIHHYDNLDKMEAHFPGWNELGFMHPEPGKETDFDCLINYREMIDWQLAIAALKLGVPPENISTEEAINTGDLSLGHASHHWASKGVVAHGRDLYIVGVDKSDRVSDFERAATTLAIGALLQKPLDYLQPDMSDPFVALYELQTGHSAPPRILWDTPENREAAENEGYHPMTYWLMSSEILEDPELQAQYDEWLRQIS